ncbi:MAG: 3-deoxy-7-phosphoheptulonate synthase, partial [Myxococcota bacterium]|nr:3-deoxy-7-phosphoheptulonate synthase [Myxococcota bacterium]
MPDSLDDGAAARALPSPAALRAALPADADAAAAVARGRAALRDALHGRDPHRLVVVAGPCSIHDPEAARDYARRLAAVARVHADALVVVMRAYVEKPRTALGWTGLVHDPHLDGSGDVREGLACARRVLREIGALGLACGGEILEPLVAPYLTDLMAWASLGARTVESQVHRRMASGLPLPVGFKNTVDGRLRPAADAAHVAARPHV